MSFKDAIDKFEEFEKEFKARKDEFANSARDLLKDEFKSVFDTTKITWLGWTQYTPYFNDGEECVFRVHELYYGYDKDPSDVYHVYDGCYTWSVPNLETLVDDGIDMEGIDQDQLNLDFEKVRDLSDAISKIDEDVMKMIFGNHVLVRVTKDGIEVIDYEHD